MIMRAAAACQVGAASAADARETTRRGKQMVERIRTFVGEMWSLESSSGVNDVLRDAKHFEYERRALRQCQRGWLPLRHLPASEGGPSETSLKTASADGSG